MQASSPKIKEKKALVVELFRSVVLNSAVSNIPPEKIDIS